MGSYDAKFFEYVNSGATQSAERMLPLLLSKLSIDSVLDVGCGQGAWLAEWRRQGVHTVTGIDGDYVDRDHLLIPDDAFIAKNLAEQFSLNQRFALVQSLEVAEHLDVSCARNFVASLVAHGDLILFSAAPKGQGGDHHVNEQQYDYWRDLFSEHGYIALDYLRPKVLHDKRIEPWYRYNTFLYVAPELIDSLPAELTESRVADGEELRDLSPFFYKVRKILVRALPVAAMTGIAKIKERLVSSVRATP